MISRCAAALALGALFLSGAGPATAQEWCRDYPPTWSRVEEGRITFGWDPVPGVSSFQLWVRTAPGYCGPFADQVLLGIVPGTSTTMPAAPSTAYAVCLLPVGCPRIDQCRGVDFDTFPLPPARPVGPTATVGVNQVTLSGSYTDATAIALLAFRAGEDGVYRRVWPDTDSGNYCAGPMSGVDGCPDGNPCAAGMLPPGAYRYRVCAFNHGNALGLAGVCSDPIAVTVGGACPALPAPTRFGIADAPLAGGLAPVAWDDAGFPGTTRWVVEGSRSPDFAPVEVSVASDGTHTLLPTPNSAADYDLFVRLHATLPCGPPGPDSAPASVRVRGVPATFAITGPSVALTGIAGGAPPSIAVGVRNVGSGPGRVQVSATGGPFSVTPDVLDLAAGAAGSVVVSATPAAMESPGFSSGLLTALSAGGSVVSVPATLTVAAAPSPPARVVPSRSTVVFSAPTGASPEAQTLEVTLDPPSAAPVTLAAAVGPGGSWLRIASGAGAPLAGAGPFPLALAVDRAKRSPADGISPFRTLLRLAPAGSEGGEAVVEVLDVETPATRAGAGRPGTPPGGTSLVVPVAVRASGASGAFFRSDGWLRNHGSAASALDLYFTPDGKDGQADPEVLAATASVPAERTMRLADLVASVFGTSGSGQVELRAAGPLAALSLRTCVEAITGDDPASRYGTEIPTVAHLAGVGPGEPELVVPAVDDDDARRTNLILAETSGAPALAHVVVRDAAGVVVGALDREVPPLGKVQVNRLGAAAAPGATLTGGWAGVSVSGSSGRVFPLATVIDNRSNSFSALAGQTLLSAKEYVPPAGTALVVPSVARLTGAYDTLFTTSLTLVNASASSATLALTYHYIDADDGGAVKAAGASLTLPPRASLARSLGGDVVRDLFHVTNRSYGWISVQGDVTRVVAASAVSAQVDPGDPAKGFKTAQVNGLLANAPDVIALGSPDHFFDGAEKSVQRRTNLILVEVSGAPADVLVRATGRAGELLGERTFRVEGRRYVQINDVFGDAGLAVGAGPFQDVVLGARVVSGSGRVVAVATVNDNVSRNPEIFVLKPPGVVPAEKIP